MRRMGKEELLNKVISEGKHMVCGGLILALLGAFMDLMFITSGYDDSLIIPMCFFGLHIIAGIILIIFGGANVSHPENSGYIKNNPDILEKADQLFSNIIYEDMNVIMSDQVIASKRNLFEMLCLKNITCIYKSKKRSNQLVLEDRNRTDTIEIKIYPKRRPEREKVLQLLSAYCPEARFGVGIEEVPPLTQMENNDYREMENKNNSMYN